MPGPVWGGAGPRTSRPWLDLLEWRTRFLAECVSRQAGVLAKGSSWRIGLKVAGGDYAAVKGTDLGRTLRMCPAKVRERVDVHFTNGHSLSQVIYAHDLCTAFASGRLIVENDGNRYGRTELAKIALNALLGGAAEYDFSHLGHLTGGPPGEKPTDSAKTLRSVRLLLERYGSVRRPATAIALLHSNRSSHIRAPNYTNHDVDYVYDSALSNSAPPDSRAFDWGRWLGMPDVVGESHVRAGRLDSRKMIVLPNLSHTLLPEDVALGLKRWVEAGGTLVLFGSGRTLVDTRAGAVRWDLLPAATPTRPLSGSLKRAGEPRATVPARSGGRGVAPKNLPPNWLALWKQGSGMIAVMQRNLGKGRLVLFPDPIRRGNDAPKDGFWGSTVPQILLAEAVKNGCPPAFTMVNATTDSPAPVLAARYLGVYPATGRHVFAAGAFDGRSESVEIGMTGPAGGEAEWVFVDLPDLTATDVRASKPLKVERSAPTQAGRYRDPTNTEKRPGVLIPFSVVRCSTRGLIRVRPNG
jgi:hypothetical protein